MYQAPITISGIPIPSDAPVFLALLAVHVVAGIFCVIVGLLAMLSAKRPGRHPLFGGWYYWGLVIVVVTMTIIAALRWAEDAHLFGLGMLSIGAAVVGRRAAPSRSTANIRLHIAAMGLSYILLLTAFYVDNGKHLPLWRNLPAIAYWLIPMVIGVPLIVRAIWYHPRVRVEDQRAGPGAS